MNNAQSKITKIHSVYYRGGCTVSPVIGLTRFNPGRLNKGPYLTLKLRSDPTAAESVTHNFVMPFFNNGEAEEWLLFLKNLKRVFHGQNLHTGPSQFQITRSLLEGDVLPPSILIPMQV